MNRGVWTQGEEEGTEDLELIFGVETGELGTGIRLDAGGLRLEAEDATGMKRESRTGQYRGNVYDRAV
jgi:hypothetical protein